MTQDEMLRKLVVFFASLGERGGKGERGNEEIYNSVRSILHKVPSEQYGRLYQELIARYIPGRNLSAADIKATCNDLNIPLRSGTAQGETERVTIACDACGTKYVHNYVGGIGNFDICPNCGLSCYDTFQYKNNRDAKTRAWYEKECAIRKQEAERRVGG